VGKKQGSKKELGNYQRTKNMGGSRRRGSRGGAREFPAREKGPVVKTKVAGNEGLQKINAQSGEKKTGRTAPKTSRG